ncbi:hypothetical protein, partial [Pseudomonas viridiflava]|uniref:hypothetical protein n=1 Tax=Pseudomonas viridiflava TaxID=33069 RepID=UPI00197E7DA7
TSRVIDLIFFRLGHVDRSTRHHGLCPDSVGVNAVINQSLSQRPVGIDNVKFLNVRPLIL